MKKLVQVIGSPIVFCVCLLALLFGYINGWYASGAVFIGLVVIVVLGVSSALISKDSKREKTV